jgi:hypothetical protein
MLKQNSEKISTHSKIIVQQLNYMTSPIKLVAYLQKKLVAYKIP